MSVPKWVCHLWMHQLASKSERPTVVCWFCWTSLENWNHCNVTCPGHVWWEPLPHPTLIISTQLHLSCWLRHAHHLNTLFRIQWYHLSRRHWHYIPCLQPVLLCPVGHHNAWNQGKFSRSHIAPSSLTFLQIVRQLYFRLVTIHYICHWVSKWSRSRQSMTTSSPQSAYPSQHTSTGYCLHFQHSLCPGLPPGNHHYIPILRSHHIPPHRTLMMTHGQTSISHVSTPTATQMTSMGQLLMCQIQKMNTSLLLSRLKGWMTTIIASRSTVFKLWLLLACFSPHQVTTNIQGSTFSTRLRSSITDWNLKQSACIYVVVVSFGCPADCWHLVRGWNNDQQEQWQADETHSQGMHLVGRVHGCLDSHICWFVCQLCFMYSCCNSRLVHLHLNQSQSSSRTYQSRVSHDTLMHASLAIKLIIIITSLLSLWLAHCSRSLQSKNLQARNLANSIISRPN